MKPAPPHDRQTAGAARLTTEWAAAARRGDQTAFHNLVERYRPEIFRMIYYRTQSRLDADDLTQDVFVQAFKHMTRLKSPAVFRSWLYRIAINKVRDHHRKKRLRSLLGMISVEDKALAQSADLADPPTAPARLARAAFRRRLAQAMRPLSKMEREVFMLRFFDQLAIKEISAALKKNESTIKTHLYRAMQKVRHGLTDMDGLLEEL